MLPATISEPHRTTSGAAAGVRVLVTLAIFVVAFMAFLVAPLITIAVAALGYSALRSRDDRPGGGPPPDGPDDHGVVSHQFGTGAR